MNEHEISKHDFDLTIRGLLANVMTNNSLLTLTLEQLEEDKKVGKKIRYFMEEGVVYYVAENISY